MLAASWSSAAARTWRPSRARDRNTCRPTRTTTATEKTITDSYPIDSWLLTWKDADASDPEGRDWLFADRPCKRPFWMTIESPNVTRRVVMGLTSRLRWMTNRW